MENFPNEIILNIFDYLDREALKETLNVCKRFRELIISSRRLMRRLPLNLSKNWFNKVEFSGDFGDYVQVLKMDYCTFDSFDEFRTILNLFPCIEKLKINYIYIKQPPIELCRPTTSFSEPEESFFPDLKSVEISSKFWGYITQIDSKILNLLNTDNLEELRIKLPMQKFSPDFINFLCKQKKLKTLQVFDEFIDSFLFDDFTESLTYNNFISSLFELDLSERVTFQLKKFAIHYRGDHRENFSKFLSTQNELEELEIRKYDDDFVRFKISFDLMRDFRVRKLSIPLDLMTGNTLDDVERFVNPHVQDLRLIGYNNDPVLFNLMLKLFPNLKTLRLEYMLEFPCVNLALMPHLENIHAKHFKIDSLANVKIPKLKKLVIGNLYPFVYTDWEGITKVNANIQEFVIKEVSHFNTMTAIKNSLGIFLRDLNQLQYLKIIQNESPDCLKIVADMRHKKLRLSPYATKMCKEMLVQYHPRG
jgi:hypothetical protein